MDKIEITIKCNEEDYDVIESAILKGLKDDICPFSFSEKPECCGEDADCNRCVDENIEIGLALN